MVSFSTDSVSCGEVRVGLLTSPAIVIAADLLVVATVCSSLIAEVGNAVATSTEVAIFSVVGLGTFFFWRNFSS